MGGFDGQDLLRRIAANGLDHQQVNPGDYVDEEGFLEGPDTDDSVKVLDRDLADEVFCGEIQDMVILCYEVIKLNFRGFFKKLGARSGSLAERLRRTVTPTSVNGESST